MIAIFLGNRGSNGKSTFLQLLRNIVECSVEPYSVDNNKIAIYQEIIYSQPFAECSISLDRYR